jgi:predicted permease
MDRFWQDFRFGVRVLVKSPGFTVMAVVVLALGIGVNSAVFSIVNALLLRPVDAHEPDRLVSCYSKNMEKADSYRAFSYPEFCEIRDRNSTFTTLAAHNLVMVGLREGETTRRVFADVVSANYFSTLGAHLLRGREFIPDEERPGSDVSVAIVSYQYWARNASDPDLIGKSIRINERPFTVIGITPRDFTGTMALLSPDVWLPLGLHDRVNNDFGSTRRVLADRSNYCLFLFGRVQPGLGPAAVDARLAALATDMERAYPAENKGQTMLARPISRLSIGTDPPSKEKGLIGASGILMAMAGVVLLIACLNLANMMLARGTARRREFALRTAVGGSRGRILRQLCTESGILALMGGAAGLVMARWSSALLVLTFARLMPLNVTFPSGLDARVLSATVAFCAFSVLLFALGPALQISRPDVVDALKEQTGQNARGGIRFALFGRRNLLVLGQIALSLVLLVAAGLFIRNAFRVSQLDFGFRSDHLLLAELDPLLAGYDEARGRALYRAAIERLARIPGVDSVGMSATVPFGMVSLGCSVTRSEDARPAQPGTPVANSGAVGSGLNVIGGDYFEALGVRLLRGRPFTRTESESTSVVSAVIIDDALAKRLWPGRDGLGRHIRILKGDGTREQPKDLEVVGIVPTLREDIFGPAVRPHVYLPFGQRYQSNMTIHLRIAPRGGDAEAALLQSTRREIRSLDDRLPILALRPMQRHLDESASFWLVRTGARMFSVFGAVALLLATVGIYGIKAYTVARRTREIGIRIALGATTRQTLWLVLKEGLVVTAVGLAIGLVLAMATGRLLSSLLTDVSASDPWVLLTTPLILGISSLAASYVPARRAARVDPIVALRQD